MRGIQEVLNQAEILGEAILSSEEYIQMRLAEQAAMKDEEATALIAAYQEKRQAVEELLATSGMDRAALAQAGQELEDAQNALDGNEAIRHMRETNDAFTDMMKKVNNLIQFVVTGESPEEGCTGSCATCGGCH